MIETVKVCNKCQVTKPLSQFPKPSTSTKRTRNRNACKKCSNPKRPYRDLREYQKEMHKKRLYGIDNAAYLMMVASQAGMCAICNSEPSDGQLCIDHDHVTGKVRALLCRGCNTRVGAHEHKLAQATRIYIAKYKANS